MMRPKPVDLLILGAGWTADFLIPKLKAQNITYAATTTTGRDNTIKFRFDPADSDDASTYKVLPSAKTVLIVFPLKGTGQSKQLTQNYRDVNGYANNWIQLGSTQIFNEQAWNDRHSPHDETNERAIAEKELIELVGGCVLQLAGLWGGQRHPRNWLIRVAKDKEAVSKKNCVHFVHGDDVAGAIIGVHQSFSTKGEGLTGRWLVTDGYVYDWWDLFVQFGDEFKDQAANEQPLEFRKWVYELMNEQAVRALPRNVETLGRRLDARDFWKAIGQTPSVGRPT